MPLRRSPLLALVALVACTVFVCPAARAGEDEDGPKHDGPKQASALSQLEPKELAFLREKFPEWDKVDARRKEHIARNVLRLREMSPEERATLKQRMARLHGRRKGRHGGGRRGPSIFRMADAVGSHILEKLSPAVHVELAKLDVRPSMVKMTLFQLAKSKAAAGARVTFTEEELAAVPASMRKKIEAGLAAVEAAEPGKKRDAMQTRLRYLRLHLQMEAEQKRLASAAPDGRVSPERLTEATLSVWSDAVEALVTEVDSKPELLAKAVQRMGRGRMARGQMSSQDFLRSVWALERLAVGKWKDDPEAQLAADRVVRRLLIDELGVDSERVAALPGYDAGAGRRRALGKLVAGVSSRGKSSHGRAGSHRSRGDWRGGERRGAERRGPGGSPPRRRKAGDGPAGDQPPRGDGARPDAPPKAPSKAESEK